MAGLTPDIERPGNFDAGGMRRYVDQTLQFFAAVRKAGGFVTAEALVKAGLITADLQPHLTQQVEADDRIPPPLNLDLAEELYSSFVANAAMSQATYKSRIIADWNTAGPRANSYEVELSLKVDGEWTVLRSDVTPALAHRFDTLDPGTYLVRIRTVGSFNLKSRWETAEITLVGKDAPPRPPVAVSPFIEKNQVRIHVIYPDDIDLGGATIRLGSSWETGREIGTLSYPQDALLWNPDTAGNLQFFVKTRDMGGVESTSATGSDLITITRPDFPPGSSISPQVVDNNVLLKWPEASLGTYPIDVYEIRMGLLFETAELIGEIRSTFFPYFVPTGGTYKYWVVAKDTAGLRSGIPLSIYATMSQPPDFILRSQQALDWPSGTMTNCMTDPMNGTLVAPVNTTETFEGHFQSRGWAGPQDQVDAGFTQFIQPGAATGSWVGVIDCETILSGTRITLDLTRTTAAGNVTLTPTISVSSDNVSWTDYAGVYQAYATGFRYVKVTLDFATADGGIMNITGSTIRLDLKQQTLALSVNLPSTVGDGDQINFSTYGVTFIDVDSIVPGAPFLNDPTKDPVSVIFNFVDEPHPTSFKGLAYDRNGNRIALTGSNKASFMIRGV